MSINGDLDTSTNVWTNPLNGSLTSTLGGSTNSILPGPRFKVSNFKTVISRTCYGDDDNDDLKQCQTLLQKLHFRSNTLFYTETTYKGKYQSTDNTKIVTMRKRKVPKYR